MKHKITSILLAFTLFLTAVGIVAIFYLVFVDGRMVNVPVVFSVPQGGVQVEKKIYEVGDIIRVRLNFCKSRNIEGVWRWSLLDDVIVSFPTKVGNVPKGCHNVWTEIGKISPSLRGEKDVHLEASGAYQLNRFNTVTATLKSESFSIK